ncbi:uncharacterized protein LOC108734179 isoform X2 [Agrilus planipennis]|nr:uncharacterized protein LOC108734179 isoform X2 [Agrilus planipennis]
MSYVEIEKKMIHDLLNCKPNSLDIFSIKNVRIEPFKNECEALKLLFLGEARRELVNCDSYNSHLRHGILTFHIMRKKKNQTNPHVISSKLHLIDLAGCDNPMNLTCSLKSMTDVSLGNSAKSELEQFALTLIEDVSVHIKNKRRTNILLSYLGDSLDSCNLLRFISHVRTGKDHLQVTLSLLRLLQLIRNVKPKKTKGNEIFGPGAEEYQIKKKLKDLIRDSKINAMITNGTLSTNINQDRIQHVRNTIESYLTDNIDDVVILNVIDSRVALNTFRDMYKTLEEKTEENIKMAYEKAYSDALEHTKGRSAESKSSMRPSKPSISKKSSVKSKDSTKDSNFVDNESRSTRKKRRSLESRISEKSRAEKKGTGAVSEQGSKLLRRSKGSSLMQMKREKRRSSSVMSLSAIGMDEKMIKELALPESIPDPQIAWDAFTLSEGYQYKELKEELTNADSEAKEKHFYYLYETKQIEKCLELVDLRRDELYQASAQDKLYEKLDNGKEENPEEVAEEEKQLTELEKACLELLCQAEGELIQQQERALEKQAELKVSLDRVRQLKKDVRKQFQKFCRDTYSTISIKMSVEPENECLEKILELEDNITEKTDIENLDEKPNPAKTIFEHFQCVMRKERERWKKVKKKMRKWTFTYKL